MTPLPTDARADLRRSAAWPWIFALALVAGIVLELHLGEVPLGVRELWSALAGEADATTTTIARLRLWRALTIAGTGASLAVAGVLVQGVFQNPLAGPGLLGLSAGAALFAVATLIALGGAAHKLDLLGADLQTGLVLVPASAFLGSVLVALVVWRLGLAGRRPSIPTTLLLGIAMNILCAGAQQFLQALALPDWEVSRSILVWSFGSFEDRSAVHAALVWSGLAIALLVVPFVGRELDLLRGGVQDARALGVDDLAVSRLSLLAAAASVATSTAVCGQIPFVGLIVPHLARATFGRAHRPLAFAAALCGAAFLLWCDVATRAAGWSGALPPGVLLALLGGPLFLYLLHRSRREVAAW
jgi:iron complex transport system permease protein